MAKTTPCKAPLETIRAALRQLAASRPVGKLRHADIARVAGLPWQTVRKLLGPRERFAEWLAPNAVASTEDTRSRILAGAAHVFAERGFMRASIDEVAKAAGLTKGAVYWHFKSKDDLFFALLDVRCAEIDAYLPDVMAEAATLGAQGSDARRALVFTIGSIYRRIAAAPEWSRLFIEFLGQTRDPAVHARLGERYRQFYASGVATILNDNPELGETMAYDLAVFWTALIDGLLLASMLNSDTLDIETRIERIVHLLWDGLGPRHAFIPYSPRTESP